MLDVVYDTPYVPAVSEQRELAASSRYNYMQGFHQVSKVMCLYRAELLIWQYVHICRYSIFAWGSPGFLLCASIFIQYREKAGKLWDTKSLDDLNCWWVVWMKADLRRRGWEHCNYLYFLLDIRFLDNNAYMYGFLVPCCLLVLSTFSYLVRAAVVARYVTSMQVDKRARDKMRRKRTLQLFLFTKVNKTN